MAPSSSNTSNTSSPSSESGNAKPAKPVAKSSTHHGFGTNMPMMSSAFDTAMWSTPV